MYQIILNGSELAVTERPTYIRLQSNGAYGLCERADAQGIAYEGTPYHVQGFPDLGGEDIQTVILYEIDGGKRLMNTAAQAAATRTLTEIAFVTMAENDTIPQTTAAEHPEAFPAWATGVSYAVGQYRTYQSTLYRCVQAHTSQSDWTPDTAASLWTLAADPTEEYPEWIAPTGAHNAYAMGDKVTHNGTRYVSTVDSNVWEPGVYGWEEVSE